MPLTSRSFWRSKRRRSCLNYPPAVDYSGMHNEYGGRADNPVLSPRFWEEIAVHSTGQHGHFIRKDAAQGRGGVLVSHKSFFC